MKVLKDTNVHVNGGVQRKEDMKTGHGITTFGET